MRSIVFYPQTKTSTGIVLGGRLLAAILVVLLGGSTRLSACMVIEPTAADRVSQASEKAIIIWDAKTRTEHFIRRAKFHTKAEHFGFLVPTPAEPELAEVDDTAFRRLEHAVEPEVIVKHHYRPIWTLIGESFRPVQGVFSTADTAMSEAEDVEVLQETKVAGYDAAVLRANDPQALLDWLSRQGYPSKPEMAEWLSPYIEKSWIITAFKYSAQDKGTVALNTKALRMSFVTDRPFYPYREPAEQSKKAARGRSLTVSFIADNRVQGQLGEGGPLWPGQVEYADRRDDIRKLLQEVLPASRQPRTAWLTVFTDSSAVRPGRADVYFRTSDDKTRLVPPPIIQYGATRTVPIFLDVLLVIFLTIVLIVRWVGRRGLVRQPIPHAG